MGIAEDAAARFKELAEQGANMVGPNGGSPNEFVPVDMHYAWRTQVISSMRTYLPTMDPHSDVFEQVVITPSTQAISAGVGILRGLEVSATNGDLHAQMTNRITASVFIDFLDMAAAIAQDDEHFQGGALIAGAVLEDTLRKICDLHGIGYTKGDGIDSLSKNLGDASVYKNAAAQKRVDVWRETRNNAMHGHWDNIPRTDVTEMVEGVTKVIDDYLP